MAAATHYVIPLLPTPVIAGVQFSFQVQAVDNSNVVDGSYTGTANVTSIDPIGKFPSTATFVSGLATVTATFKTVGLQSITFVDQITSSIAGTQKTTVQNSKGWGFDPYGLSPYGGAELGVGIRVLSALALSTNEVQLNLSGEPTHSSPYTPGDALNPSTWVVQRLDTNAFLHVVEVAPINPETYGIYTLEPFGPAAVTHVVSTSVLLDAAGGLVNPPRSANFAGILNSNLVSAQSRASARRISARDIANVQSPDSANLVGGTLKITGAGDYASVTGDELMRKLIIRRIMSTPGDFFHLPNYGVGIKQKEPLPVSEISKLKAQIEAQVKLEPEVQSVISQLSLDANNVLTLILKALIKATGQTVDVTLPVPTAGVLF